MLRMEIALFLVIAFIACMYFSAERKRTQLNRIFSVLLITVLVHLIFDGITVYTVARLDTVPELLNEIVHRLFIGTMVLIVYLFYKYISVLVAEESGRHRYLDRAANIFLVLAEIGVAVLPVHYAVTPLGNYSDGIQVAVCYASVTFYLLMCAVLLVFNWKQLQRKERLAVGVALIIQCSVSLLQSLNPTWLISGAGITLMTLSFYLTLENPDILRAELTEQKISMKYLKSQVNPHFLYNTMDMINWLALQGRTSEISNAVQNLSRFYKLTLSRKKSITTIAKEEEHVSIYVRLQNMRFHDQIQLISDIPDELMEYQIPRLTLQPVIENAILHGILEKESKEGTIVLTGWMEEEDIILLVSDDGVGIPPEKLSTILSGTGKSISGGSNIAIYNTHRRLQLLYGECYGLSYSSPPGEGTEVQIRIPAHKNYE